MFKTWIRGYALKAQIFVPTEQVVMRKPKGSLYPPQATCSVGISLLTDTAKVAIAALPAVICFIRIGIAPTA